MSEYKMLFGFATPEFNENMAIVVEETPEYFVVKKPLTLFKQMASENSMGVAFIPFMFSSGAGKDNKLVRIYKSQILWSADEANIDEDLLNSYTTQTTGLVIAGAKMPSKSSLLVK